jgi:hypothetical protein
MPGLLRRQARGAATAEQTGAVGDKGLDRFRRQIAEAHRHRFRLEHQADRMLEHHRIGPAAKLALIISWPSGKNAGRAFSCSRRRAINEVSQ